jgi:hypothetical protein
MYPIMVVHGRGEGGGGGGAKLSSSNYIFCVGERNVHENRGTMVSLATVEYFLPFSNFELPLEM